MKKWKKRTATNLVGSVEAHVSSTTHAGGTVARSRWTGPCPWVVVVVGGLASTIDHTSADKPNQLFRS